MHSEKHLVKTLRFGVILGIGIALGHQSIVQATLEEVPLRIDGKLVRFHSEIVDRDLPAVMVQGCVMVSVRLFDEMLDAPLSLYTAQWGVFHVDGVAFKLGVKEASTEMAGLGGHPAWRRPLPVAPQIINGSIYVPLRVFAETLGHKVTWDPKTWTVSIDRSRPREEKPCEGH